MPLQPKPPSRDEAGTTGQQTDLWTAYIDASALPNPGRMALGALITAPDGSRHRLSQACPGQGCNNEAELRALMEVLRILRGLHARRLSIFTDSSILVEQLGPSPHSVRPIARLAGLFDQARVLMAGFDEVRLQWIPRHRNTEADALARAALAPA
jgi:ribonuclease HI